MLLQIAEQKQPVWDDPWRGSGQADPAVDTVSEGRNDAGAGSLLYKHYVVKYMAMCE